MKYVEACLNGREDRESSFHSSGGRVWLVEAGLYAGKT